MDELMWEKDGDISRMKQFHYKIHKFKPFNDDLLETEKKDAKPKAKPKKTKA